MTDPCTLKAAFENEQSHTREYREENDKDHRLIFSSQRDHDVRITKMETKIALYSTLSGAGAALIFRFIERFLP